MSSPTTARAVLLDVLQRLPPEAHGPLVLDAAEVPVPATRIEDPHWIAEQIHLRGARWNTDDLRVLATLWWYSASAWLIVPTLSTLALGTPLLSADLDDLTLHWLPDSRIRGATSAAICDGTDVPRTTTERIEVAGATLRSMYQRVIPVVADLARTAPGPLWGIATDAVATRLVSIGRSIGDIESTTALAQPLVAAVGPSMPRARFEGEGEHRLTRRCSCCLLYLAPDQAKCGNCPRRRR